MNRFWLGDPDSFGLEQIAPRDGIVTSVAGCYARPKGMDKKLMFINDFINDIGGRDRIILLTGQHLIYVSDSCMPCQIIEGRKAPMESHSWLQAIEAKLSSMRNLMKNWNGYGSAPPNKNAFKNADEVIDILHQKGYEAHQVSPSADEGIAISFLKGGRHAFIECYNDGDIAAAVFQKQGEPETWDCGSSASELTETIERIFEYLNGR
ncbi:MAG: hypothetical protein ABSC04_20655 [Syntrophobacteraceae bacterium]